MGWAVYCCDDFSASFASGRGSLIRWPRYRADPALDALVISELADSCYRRLL